MDQTIPGQYIPSFEYFRVAENEFSPDVLLQINNVLSAVFYIENNGIEVLSKEVKKLYIMIKDEEIEVISLFIRWFNNYLGNIKDMDEELKTLSSLKEVPGMLATSLEIHDQKIADEARQLGIEQGIEQGIEHGIERGKKEALIDSVNRLKQKGFSAAEISELLDIPVEDIE